MIPFQQTGESTYFSPLEIIYRQIDRLLMARQSGYGASECLRGLMTIVEPYKDAEYENEMESIRDNGNTESMVWNVLESIICLLHRKGMWPAIRKAVNVGEEFLHAGIDG